jgi:hypothetical protein
MLGVLTNKNLTVESVQELRLLISRHPPFPENLISCHIP